MCSDILCSDICPATKSGMCSKMCLPHDLTLVPRCVLAPVLSSIRTLSGIVPEALTCVLTSVLTCSGITCGIVMLSGWFGSCSDVFWKSLGVHYTKTATAKVHRVPSARSPPRQRSNVQCAPSARSTPPDEEERKAGGQMEDGRKKHGHLETLDRWGKRI